MKETKQSPEQTGQEAIREDSVNKVVSETSPVPGIRVRPLIAPVTTTHRADQVFEAKLHRNCRRNR